jgi:Ca2+-binding EF-hand superfamily protein
MAACISTLAVADDRADYNRRSAERYIAMFRLADLNKDNVVTVGEAQGIIELQAHFSDIDTDRDGDITRDELTRYIEATFR